jgi:hypothetical protein
MRGSRRTNREAEYMNGMQNIRTTSENRDSLLQLKLRISAAIKREMSMGDILGLLVKLGESHYPELVKLAEDKS